MGSDPPLVSIWTSDSSRPVETFTDATWAMWITSSSCPIHFGLYCTTLSEVTSTCVGKSRLPELHRLVRKTLPGANGRPFRQINHPNKAKIATAAAASHHQTAASPVTDKC